MSDKEKQFSCSEKDNNGLCPLTSGVWNSSCSLSVDGGQGMHFAIKNVSVIGTSISITSRDGQTQGTNILPQQTVDLEFSCFGKEPMSWVFDIKTYSSAFIVAWKLYSNWVPGIPPNG
jgi:hypothetical protein